jgi:hypothetical protein
MSTVTESEMGKRLPEALRHPIAVLQERIDALEAHARGRLRRALDNGNARIRGLDEALARVAREDWSVPGMRRHLDELRARAENLRASATKRVQEMPGTAVSALASGGRTRLQHLSRGLEEISKRLEAPPRPNGGTAAQEPAGEPKKSA